MNVSSTKKPKSSKSKETEKRVSYYRKPIEMSVNDWQWLLRKQFGEDNEFKITKIGDEHIFSDYLVYNPKTVNNYRVSLRDFEYKNNFCNCLDFKTNRLGICKHIAATIKFVNSKFDEKTLKQASFLSPYSSIYLDYKSGRHIKLKIGKENEAEFIEFRNKYFSDSNELLATSFPVFEKILQEAKNINSDFICYEDALEYVIDIRENLKRKIKFGEFFKKNPDLKALEDNIKIKLFPYQLEGVKFAAKAGRSLIADDMGLGKTIQAIVVAELNKKVLGTQKVLIVCPTSLKYQWKSEIERFTNSTVHVIEGNILKRKEQYRQLNDYYFITSYNTLANDVNFINDAVELDMVILDEAQRIKNWKTKVSKSVKKLNATYSVVLTGTPLENKIEELYSIMQFVDLYKLGPLYQFVDRHQIKDPDSGKVIGYQYLNEITHLLSDTLIRRTKTEVLKQLPERMDKNLYVPMTTEQRDIHDEYQTVVSKLVSKWRRFGFLSEPDRKRLILSLSKMRMVCDSTFILDQRTRKDTKIDELMNILEEFFQSDNSKVVIFSQWERMTRLVADELDKNGIGYEYLHGGVPSEKRQKLLVNFRENENSKVFLSTDAGGVGLNLQSASLIINLDIPWNPAVLEQRIARVYRLGQQRNVTVINLISTGTIEHKMLDVLKFKSSMASGVLDGGEDTIFLNNDQFKEFMESLEEVSEQTQAAFGDETEPEINFEQPAEGKKEEGSQDEILGDDDTEEVEDKGSHQENPANELVIQGMSFLGNLFTTLQNPDATKELVNSIIEKDKDGKSYLKIPIENNEAIENGIKALGGLLASFMGKK